MKRSRKVDGQKREREREEEREGGGEREGDRYKEREKTILYILITKQRYLAKNINIIR